MTKPVLPGTIFTGKCSFQGGFDPVDRTGVINAESMVHPIDLTKFFVSTTGQPLPNAATGSIIGIEPGTFGTGCPVLTSGTDVKNSTVSRSARLLYELPPTYVAGSSVTIRLNAATRTTVATASSTVDVQAYKVGASGLVDGGDLCSTADQSINSVSFADKDFVLSGATLQPGDMLDILVTLASTDSATPTVVSPAIAKASAILQRVC